MREILIKVLMTVLVAGVAVILMATQGLLPQVSQALQESWEIVQEEPADEDAPHGVQVDPDAGAELLEDITIGEHQDVAYDREEQFGSGWGDPDGNGCDARNDILARDLNQATIDDDGCTVLDGLLHDPFTGEVIDFERGQGTSQLVHIDHMVPLSWAAQAGALDWTQEQRWEFANDPDNLLAVDGSANSAKGDSGPGQWLPDNEEFHCEYVTIFLDVVDQWDLTMPPDDAQAAQEVLAGC